MERSHTTNKTKTHTHPYKHTHTTHISPSSSILSYFKILFSSSIFAVNQVKKYFFVSFSSVN